MSGGLFDPRAAPEPGETHAGCVLERLLGRGGMGSVHLARRQVDGQQVVVKFLAPELARDPTLRARFQREWDALRKLHPPHPNIVRVFEVQAESEQPCIVMECVQGRALDELLLEGQRFTPKQVAEIGLGMARGLAAVHAHGLIHRDVKPANVILEPSGAIKIIDFGLAKDLFLSGLTKPGQLLGTAYYMAPEQWEEEGIDVRCDVWALGATLYHLLVGTPPFDGESMDDIADAILDGAYTRPSEAAAGVPPELELAVTQMMMTDPALRYPRMEDCAEDLERVLRGEAARVPCLVGDQGQRSPLLVGEWFTLGSEPGCPIQVAHPSVAPKHAQLRRQAGSYVLRDLQSPSGTFVGAEQVVAGRGRALRSGDRLRLGEVELVFLDPWAQVEQAGASWLQDVGREEEADPIVECLADLGDARAVLTLLERLGPERAGGQDDRLLAELFGPDLARAAAARREEDQRSAGAGTAERLAGITQVTEISDAAGWLSWWHQVRGTAPAQVVPRRPKQSLRLRVTQGHAPLELPLETPVVLIGRDQRCQLRLQRDDVPRLIATLLRLHRRWAVIDEGQGGAVVSGAQVRAGYVDPGDVLLLAGCVQVVFEAAPREAQPLASGVYALEPATFDALAALNHPSVAAALVGFLREAGQLEWAATRARALFEDPAQVAAFGQRLRARYEERAERARRALPALLGADAGADPAAWGQLLEQRRAGLPAQVAPYGWLAATR